MLKECFMTNESFLIYLLESFDIYLICFLLSCIVYYLLYRKVLDSIFDPLTLQVVGSMFGFSVVLFLYSKDLILTFYFTNYLFTQFAFLAGFFLVKQKALNNVNYPSLQIKNDLLITETCFIVFSTLNIVLQLISYFLVGIPMFKDSRLETYMAGGGIGLIGRLLSILVILGLFTGIVTFFKTKKKSLKIVVILYCVITAVFFFLSGSRSSFITFFLVLFFYKVMTGERQKTAYKNIYWLGLIVFVAIFIMYLKADSLLDAFSGFLTRIVGFGDVYWGAYPEEKINRIVYANPFDAIFGDLLASYRIIGWDKIPKPIGLQLTNINYPYLDVTLGPNARHNVFGLVYFGYIGSIFFSFFIGLFLGMFRMWGLKKMRNPGVLGMIYCVLYLRLVSIETDIGFVVAELNSLVITLIVVLPITLIMYYNIRKYG